MLLGSTQYFFSGIEIPDEFDQWRAREEKSHQVKAKSSNLPRPVKSDAATDPSLMSATSVQVPQGRGILSHLYGLD